MTPLSWKPVHKVNTAAVVRWTRKYLDGCDPYLVWADASTHSPTCKKEPSIAVLVELNKDNSAADLPGLINQIKQPACFISNQWSYTYPTSFVTGLVNCSGLCQLIEDVRQRKIQRFTLQGTRADLSSMAFREFSNSPTAQRRVSTAQISPPAEVAGPTYLGILDDGLPFLRVRDSVALAQPPAHLWDQGWQREGMVVNPDNPQGDAPSDDDPYWRRAGSWALLVTPSGIVNFQAEGFLYGRRTKKPPTPGSLVQGDQDEYRGSRYVHPAPRQTHGASVLGLMAPWLSTRRGGKVEWPLDDVAGLAMVQLPTPTVDDTSGGSLAMRVLDGIRYVLWQEQEDRDSTSKTARPTVVNISYGIHGGPHNGSSMFERAALEALEQNKHLHLVLPMGNAHRAGIHARHCLAPWREGAEPTTLKLRVMPDNPRDTFLEIWLPQDAKVKVEIVPPGSKTSYLLEHGQARMAYEPEDEKPETPRIVHFAGIYPARVADSTSGTMVLVAIGATRVRQPRPSEGELAFNPVGANQQPRRTVIAPAGEWSVRLRNVTQSEFEVNAWIQRNDPAPDRLSSSRQACFLDSAPDNTINGVATFKHDHLHVIGAMRSNGRLSWYSAARRRFERASPPPNVVTVADWSPAVHGILSLGFTQGAVTRLDGTSAACAVYSRALAKQLKKDPTKLPRGAPPGFVEPEIDSGPEDEPSAPDALRGEDVRMFLPFDVEPVT